MDIYAYLKKDHRIVDNLFEQIKTASDINKRENLFDIIKNELLVHLETEEKTFYKAINKNSRSNLTDEKMEHVDKEHDEIKKYLSDLSKLALTESKWLITLGELEHAVKHHVEEEETDVFERAKKILSSAQAIKIAQDMDNLKHKKTEKQKADTE